MSSQFSRLISQAQDRDRAFRWTEATKLYAQAAEVATTTRRRAYALHNAAISSRRGGQLDKALRFVSDAEVALADDELVPTHAEVKLTHGNVLVDLGRSNESVPYLENAADLFQQLELVSEHLTALIGLGRARALLGDSLMAEQLFSEVLDRASSPEVISQALSNLAMIRQREGRTSEAEKLLRQDIDLCKSNRDDYGEAVALKNLASVYIDVKRNSEAIRLLQKARALFETQGLTQDLTVVDAALNELQEDNDVH